MSHDITRLPSTVRSGAYVWAIRCVICRDWVRLGPALGPKEEFAAKLGDAPVVHEGCRDTPSTETPTLEGMGL